jgi:hypothetical protein
MTFIMCDAPWGTLPDGAITCTGTLQVVAQDSLMPPGMTTEDATTLAYSAMGLFAIVFALLVLKRALN